MRAHRVVAPLLGLLASAVETSAQEPSARQDELNQAILRYAFRYNGGSARVIPGQVPDDLAPSFYAPAGTRVLGTIISGSSAIVLAATSAGPDSLRAEYARALEPRGWKSWEPMTRGGFVESASGLPIIFCRQDAQLQVTHRRRPTLPHDLQLEYREAPGMCESAVSARRPEFVGMERPQFPTLRSPDAPASRPRTTCYSRGGGGRSGSFGTSTVVSTDLTAAALLEFYGRQLESTGWRPPGRGDGRSTAAGTWARPDTAGTVQVKLEVMDRGSGCFDVQMTMSQ